MAVHHGGKVGGAAKTLASKSSSSKMEVVKGMIAGFAVGVIWELMIITPLMSDWTIRSIIVALSVSGFGCSIAGAVFAIGKNKKNENKNAKVEVIA
ncbi:hypothetical protein SAMN06297422_1122 [Lachnospiraceae bacterium]|nr:hypothetical protein SAMN06297422_1122 [Lachnospiraceae bacterium]